MKQRNILWGLCAISWACGDISPSQPSSVTESRGQATQPHIEWDSELGQNRVWIGEDKYYLERKPGDAVNQFTRNGMTFVYQEQAIFSATASTSSERRTVFVQDVPPQRSLTEKIVGTLKTDREGRVWKITRIDESSVRQRIQAYNSLVRSTFGEEFPCGETATSTTPTLPQVLGPILVEVQPMSWTHSRCSFPGHFDHTWMNQDRRRVMAPDFDDAQKKQVALFYNGAPLCSGVMVDDGTVLTAAHCVSGTDLSQLVVCTYGNTNRRTSCVEANSYSLGPDYTDSNPTPVNDYAVLDLKSSLNVGWMPLSQASADTLQASTLYKTAYPRVVPGTCNYNRGSGVHVQNPNYDSAFAYESSGDATDVWYGAIGFNMDLSSGESGSAVYYYSAETIPQGCGAPTPTAYITAVTNHAMFYWDSPTNTGARSKAIRSWVVANK